MKYTVYPVDKLGLSCEMLRSAQVALGRGDCVELSPECSSWAYMDVCRMATPSLANGGALGVGLPRGEPYAGATSRSGPVRCIWETSHGAKPIETGERIPPTSLGGLIAAVMSSSVVIGHNSGAVHLAALLGVPTICIGDHIFGAPVGVGHINMPNERGIDQWIERLSTL